MRTKKSTFAKVDFFFWLIRISVKKETFLLKTKKDVKATIKKSTFFVLDGRKSRLKKVDFLLSWDAPKLFHIFMKYLNYSWNSHVFQVFFVGSDFQLQFPRRKYYFFNALDLKASKSLLNSFILS